ncbi:hypothetical protein G6M24_32930 [Agrobacterium tumefaciens]|nr:hypothetical protein [Agrobacterium tumefaciens]
MAINRSMVAEMPWIFAASIFLLNNSLIDSASMAVMRGTFKEGLRPEIGNSGSRHPAGGASGD